MKFSVLDYGIVDKNSNSLKAHWNTIEYAKTCDEFGYDSFWITQHFNVKTLCINSISIVGSQILNSVKNIKIGFAGFLLLLDNPFKVANDIATLNYYHPNRIKLAVGSNQSTNIVRKKLNIENIDKFFFWKNVDILNNYLTDNSDNEFFSLKTTFNKQFFVLVTSVESAIFAAKRGYAIIYGYFLNPDNNNLKEVIKNYKINFFSKKFKPRIIFSIFVIFQKCKNRIKQIKQITSTYLLGRNDFNEFCSFPSFDDVKDLTFTEQEIKNKNNNLKKIIIGNENEIKSQLDYFINEFEINDVMIVPFNLSHESRIKTIKIVSKIYNLNKFEI